MFTGIRSVDVQWQVKCQQVQADVCMGMSKEPFPQQQIRKWQDSGTTAKPRMIEAPNHHLHVFVSGALLAQERVDGICPCHELVVRQ